LGDNRDLHSFPTRRSSDLWVQDVARIDVILDGELRYLVGGIVPPRREQPVAVLVDDEGGEVVVLATVFQAVLTVREDVDEIVARSEEHTSELQSPCNLVCR